MKIESAAKFYGNAKSLSAKSKLYDPRNETDFDTWSVGLEPIPFDKTWKYSETDAPA
jgi:hypothetical protein